MDALNAEQRREMVDQTEAMVLEAKALRVRSNPGYERAAEFLRGVKALQKRVTATFKPIKQKMDAAKKEVLDQEKLHMAPLKAAEGVVKKSMAAYEDALDAAREKALAEAASGEPEAVAKATRAISKAPPKAAGVGSRKDHDFAIVDASKLDRRFLIPDEKSIRAVVKAAGMDAESIVGKGSIKVSKKTRIAARS